MVQEGGMKHENCTVEDLVKIVEDLTRIHWKYIFFNNSILSYNFFLVYVKSMILYKVKKTKI